MLTADSFFDLASWGHPDLILPGAEPWAPLKKLKGYLANQNYPEFPAGLIRDREPLTKTLVFYDNEFLEADALVLECGDATRGGVKVYKSGKQLEGASVIMAGVILEGGRINFGKGVLVEAGALIKSPTVIGDWTEVRHGAYIRGNCLVGRACVVGHTTEIKHAVFLDGAKAGHFAYLGDSILGSNVNLGAGTKLANLRFIKGDVSVATPEAVVNTGLHKLGAILADGVQTGCNCVTSPGTLLGKKSIVLPNVTVPSGYHRDSSLLK